MKLVSLNIEMNRHNRAVLDFLKQKPDVICLQELLEEDVSLFKKELGLDVIFQACRHERKASGCVGKKIGVAIFAKNITARGSIFYIGEEQDVLRPFDSEHFEKSEALVWATVQDAHGIAYTFVTAHLPVTTNGESTPLQLEELGRFFAKLDTLGEFVLCGDMNAPRGWETANRLAKKYKDAIPPEYESSLDPNLFRVKGLTRMVDYVFTTPRYTATNVRLVDGLSDHMAVVATIHKD